MVYRSLFTGVLFLMGTTVVSAETYSVSLTNNLEDDFIAPVLITSTANDQEIFSDEYVTVETEEQILTGDPMALAKRIAEAGGRSFIAKSSVHESGVLLSPGSTITFEIETDATELRILAMIKSGEDFSEYEGYGDWEGWFFVQHQTKSMREGTPDNYVTGTVILEPTGGEVTKNIARYDLGYDEGRRSREATDDDDYDYKAATVVVSK